MWRLKRIFNKNLRIWGKNFRDWIYCSHVPTPSIGNNRKFLIETLINLAVKIRELGFKWKKLVLCFEFTFISRPEDISWHENPVAYFSKKVTWRSKEETYCLFRILSSKRSFLLRNKFSVFSDHKPLENLAINDCSDEELGDMMNFLTQFNFNIVYNPGKNNEETNGLS